jgi:hypothetical protein
VPDRTTVALTYPSLSFSLNDIAEFTTISGAAPPNAGLLPE